MFPTCPPTRFKTSPEIGWNRFGPIFAAEIRPKRAQHLCGWPQWRWHLDEMFVRINGTIHYLWRAERVMQRFRQMRTLQKFATVHSSVHNHFNQDRHFYSRENFKLNRSAALAEWRQFGTA